MIERLKNPYYLVARLGSPDMFLAGVIDAEDWIEQDSQFTLTDGYNMLLVKEWQDDVFEIHWAFRHRGKKALEVAIDFLGHLFHKEGARTVVGMVPAHKRAARWFSRQVGGKSHGIVQTESGEGEVFSLSREDFEAQHGFSPQSV